ncbi:MAG: serine protease [Pyrinomonadaceae bacterium]|nr:serine protease [Pyrinomonadaceae bacterium]
MAVGIIIHVAVGKEKRTELFSEETIRFGTDESCDLQILTDKNSFEGVWLELGLSDQVYRVINFQESLNLSLNGKPIHRFAPITDGDTIDVPTTDISFSFFALTSKSSLVTTNREPHIAPFIESAALESAFSPKPDDAKAFLREFVRELSREIHWTTKIIVLAIVLASLGGIFYLGNSYNNELQKTRELAEVQAQVVRQLQEQLVQNNQQLGQLDKTNKDIIKTVSLAPNLRVEYGNGVCLIVGVYDLVDKKSGKPLRYPDPQAFQPSPYEPSEQTTSEEGMNAPPSPLTLTTEGGGSTVEYDFIGTGFHVGGGYIVTNRHVIQPWEEDDLVKQMLTDANGRARVKRLVVYFPNFPQPFPLKVRQLGGREDLAIASIDPELVSPDIPVLPLETDAGAASVGRTVVTMGYPNGPDRLLAMVDDNEAKSINSRFGGSRQALINFLAQSRKIVPLTTQGAITDLDTRRIVHDAKTAEGGSGAPLFGQTARVIGVNFGVFTESNAANMAVPISFAIELLRKAGWKSPEEIKNQAVSQNQIAGANTNTAQTKPQ